MIFISTVFHLERMGMYTLFLGRDVHHANRVMQAQFYAIFGLRDDGAEHL